MLPTMAVTRGEQTVTPGMSVREAIERFEQNGHLGAKRRFQRLRALRRLLSDPVTAEQARALADVMKLRRTVSDLIRWLESPVVTWENFPLYQKHQPEFRPEEPEPVLYSPRLPPGELERIREEYRAASIKDHLPNASPCPRCGTPPEYLEWYPWSPPKECPSGYMGWKTRCRFCLTEVDFFPTGHIRRWYPRPIRRDPYIH